jgi:hypothetical protein
MRGHVPQNLFGDVDDRRQVLSSSPRILGVGPTSIHPDIHPPILPFVHPYHDTFIVIGGRPRHAIGRDPQETGDVAGNGGTHTPCRPRRPLPLNQSSSSPLL